MVPTIPRDVEVDEHDRGHQARRDLADRQRTQEVVDRGGEVDTEPGAHRDLDVEARLLLGDERGDEPFVGEHVGEHPNARARPVHCVDHALGEPLLGPEVDLEDHVGGGVVHPTWVADRLRHPVELRQRGGVGATEQLVVLVGEVVDEIFASPDQRDAPAGAGSPAVGGDQELLVVRDDVRAGHVDLGAVPRHVGVDREVEVADGPVAEAERHAGVVDRLEHDVVGAVDVAEHLDRDAPLPGRDQAVGERWVFAGRQADLERGGGAVHQRQPPRVRSVGGVVRLDADGGEGVEGWRGAPEAKDERDHSRLPVAYAPE
jgi:hypothetical protein